jgi:hypothetical protein
MTAMSYQLSTSNHQLLSWHGWQIALPEDWSPVKIEGDWSKGSILIADFHATRLALRWQVAPKRNFDANKWAERAIGSEVGQLMLKESIEYVPIHSSPLAGEARWRGERQQSIVSSAARPLPQPLPRGEGSQTYFSVGRLFLEPEPPGRDVWVGQSRVSNRLIEVVYQTKTVSRVLRDQILPAISDQPSDQGQLWSIFDLSCTVPVGWTLKSQRLNAGDLTLSFSKKNDVLIVRQLAPATLALSRQPLERWLDAQQQIWKKTYRVKGPIEAADALKTDSEHEDFAIVGRTIPRRRRFFLARWVARQRITLATHDTARDRIVIVDASSAELALQTLATIGKAAH